MKSKLNIYHIKLKKPYVLSHTKINTIHPIILRVGNNQIKGYSELNLIPKLNLKKFNFS